MSMLFNIKSRGENLPSYILHTAFPSLKMHIILDEIFFLFTKNCLNVGNTFSTLYLIYGLVKQKTSGAAPFHQDYIIFYRKFPYIDFTA